MCGVQTTHLITSWSVAQAERADSRMLSILCKAAQRAFTAIRCLLRVFWQQSRRLGGGRTVAIAIAISASVTVSIGELTIGDVSRMFLVRLALRSTWTDGWMCCTGRSLLALPVGLNRPPRGCNTL